MSAPDPAYVRMYHATVKRHRERAIRHLESLAGDIDVLRRRLEGGGEEFGSDARHLAEAAMLILEDLAAVEALREVEALTIDPDAGADS